MICSDRLNHVQNVTISLTDLPSQSFTSSPTCSSADGHQESFVHWLASTTEIALESLTVTDSVQDDPVSRWTRLNLPIRQAISRHNDNRSTWLTSMCESFGTLRLEKAIKRVV